MESSQTEELGSNGLENSSNISPNTSITSSGNSKLNSHLNNLSQYLQEKKLTLSSTLNDEENDILVQMISEIFKDLKACHALPNSEIKSGSPINESYRILTFSLYLVCKSIYNKDSDLILRNKNAQLKQELDSLQKDYDSLLQNSSDYSSVSQIGENPKSSKISAQQYDEMRKEVAKLISYLKHHFNLSESTNLHNIIDAIHIQSTCKMTEEDRIEQLMMQNQDLESRLQVLQNENARLERELSQSRKIIDDKKKDDEYATNARIFVLQNDLNAMEMQMKNCSRKCEKRGEKLKQAIQQINEKDEANKNLKHDLDSLKMKYDQLLLENEETKQKNGNEIQNLIKFRDQNQILNSEITKLKNALDLLSNEYENVNRELTKETNIKNEIFKCITKQDDALKLIEGKLEMNNQNQKSIQLTKIRSSLPNSVDDSLINECKQLLSKYSNQNSQMLETIINNDSLDNQSKISQILTILVNDLNESQNQQSALSKAEKDKLNDFEKENNRLKRYISNMVDFLDHMSTSGELRDFFINAETKPDFKDKLLVQVSKLQSFIQEKGIDINDISNANHIDISNYTKTIEEQINNPDPEELMLLVRYSGLINDSLRRFADSMTQQAESFLSEIKIVRNQMVEDKDKHADEVNELNESIKSEQMKTEAKNQILSQVQNILRTNLIDKDSDDKKVEYIGKCLELINKEIDNNSEYSINSQEYIQEIESQLMHEREIREIYEEQSKDEISKLKNEIELLTKQGALEKQLFIKEIEYAKKQLEEVSVTMKESSKSRDEIIEKDKMIDQLKEQIAKKENEMDQLQQQIESDKENQKSENDKLIKEKEERIQSLSASLDKAKHESEQNVKEVREKYKAIIKKLNNDIELETSRANDIRSHFENILKELNGKVQQANDIEKSSTDKINQYEKELKAAKSEISKLTIDNKMLNLKIITIDERNNREKSLLSSQNNLNLLRLQTDHQNEINQIKEKYDNENYEFYLKICEKFREYIDDTVNISEDTIMSLLTQVSDDLTNMKKQISDKQKIQSILLRIKSTLHIENDNEIVQTIKDIIKKSKDMNDIVEANEQNKNDSNTKNINQLESALHNWAIWARRLYSIITSNLSISKSNKEMQSTIEETLLSAIGQRQIWKKLEILRNEKAILTSGILNQKNNKNIDTTFTSLITVGVFIYRLRKNCGNTLFEPNFSLSINESSFNQD